MAGTLRLDPNGNPIPTFMLGGATVSADGTSASAATAVINADDDQLVSITVSADCYITTGATPTATNAHMRMWANERINAIVPKGHKVACLGAIVTVTLHG